MHYSHALIYALLLLTTHPLYAAEPCKIAVVDQQNGWPVPLVELRTTHGVRLLTDNAGVVAFDLPEMMGRETWLSIQGHGYSVPADGFGNRGRRVTPQPGQTITIKVHRELPGKRLGRITGAGVFGESQKLGEHTRWKEQGIVGCDSTLVASHQGRLFWIWGDTSLASYPLGRFHSTCATTRLQPLTTLRPPVELKYNYFTGDDRIPRNVAEMPGEGPTWLSGLISLPDKHGQQRLCAVYSKIKGPLTDYERGLCVWDERRERFVRHKVLWRRSPESPKPTPAPIGHPVEWTDPAGERWVMHGDPFPTLKHHPTFEAWEDPQQWIKVDSQSTVPVAPGQQAAGDQVKQHRGGIAWNEHRKKWVTVFTQIGGESSFLGEIWYAEAERPAGPWRDARKVVTHHQYSFYNPVLHPGFTPAGSPILLFEATFTHTFSKTPTPTPRHNYNQVLYRLDLDEPPFE